MTKNFTEEQALAQYSSESYFVLNKNLLRTFGPTKAIFLTNLIDKFLYFKQKGEAKDGWFFQIHGHQMKQTGISEYGLRKCKSFFKIAGILATEKRGVPAKEWYKLYIHEIQSFVGQDLTKTIGQGVTKTIGQDPAKSAGLYKNNKDKNNKINKKECESEKNLSYKKPSHIKKEKKFPQNFFVHKSSRLLTEKILGILNTNNKIQYSQSEIKEFYISIENLRCVKKVSSARINTALDWYSNHVKERFTPAIHNGQDFYNKFTNIEDAMVRYNLRLDNKKNKASLKNRKPIIPKS